MIFIPIYTKKLDLDFNINYSLKTTKKIGEKRCKKVLLR
jgi:hypothetical protein